MDKAERERSTIRVMIGMYCRGKHKSDGQVICDDCRRLLDYAISRLEKCPLGKNKKSCRKCTIHCYSPQEREYIRMVMRYAGPRMIYTHPLMAIRHLAAEL